MLRAWGQQMCPHRASPFSHGFHCQCPHAQTHVSQAQPLPSECALPPPKTPLGPTSASQHPPKSAPSPNRDPTCLTS